MKSLTQLAVKRTAEEIIKLNIDVTKKLGYLPEHLLAAVMKEVVKQRAKAAMDSGDLRRLINELSDVNLYVLRIIPKWELRGKDLALFFKQVDALRKKTKDQAFDDGDLAAFKDMREKFELLRKHQAKLRAAIVKMSRFVAALWNAQDQLSDLVNADANKQNLLDAVSEVRSHLERLVDNLTDVIEPGVKKALSQLEKMDKAMEASATS